LDADPTPGADDPTGPAPADEVSPSVSRPAFSRLRGPFDIDEVDELDGYLDLGSLLVPGIAGLGLRLELEEATQSVVAAQFAAGTSSAQVQVFAAPRTSGIWDDIRTEIAQGVTASQGRAEEADGALGTELRVTMPGGQAMRFLGVDGPRWFLRAVLSGPAATHDSAAQPLVDAVRRCIVVRGGEAMAPREALPLRLPPEAQGAPEGAGGTEDVGEGLADGDTRDGSIDAAAPRMDDLRPFERGPEITEVR